MKEGKTEQLRLRWTQALDALTRDKVMRKMAMQGMALDKKLIDKFLRAFLF